MKINISEDSGIISVSAEIPSRNLSRDPIVECNYQVVRQILAEKGYEDLVSVSGRNLVISNGNDNSALTGEWKFKTAKEETTPPPKSKSSTRRKRATKPKNTPPGPN